MVHVSSPQGRALGLQRLSIAAAAWLSACAVTPAPASQPTPAPPQNPVLAAVATAPLNTPIATPGQQTVTVLSDYTSGEGDECRAYTRAAPGAAPAQNLACQEGGTWRNIPPLAPSANPVVLP